MTEQELLRRINKALGLEDEGTYEEQCAKAVQEVAYVRALLNHQRGNFAKMTKSLADKIEQLGTH